MKHLEVRQKYSAARRIFNSLLTVSSGDETLRLMLDILRQLVGYYAFTDHGAWNVFRFKINSADSNTENLGVRNKVLLNPWNKTLAWPTLLHVCVVMDKKPNIAINNYKV